jgi:dsRNA-specific ribonuclease
MLGDSLLKLVVSEHVYLQHPDMAVREGLSVQKDKIIYNKHLSEVAQRTGLARYLRAAPLCGADGVQFHFPSPGLVSHTVTSTTEGDSLPCQFVSLAVHFKKLADLVEAVIGACLLSGGVSGGVGVMSALGLLPRGEDATEISVGQIQILQPQLQSLDSVHIPPQLCDLEAVLRYSFRSTAILSDALTLKGFENERLEFLGDAVLDFIVAGILFREQPDMNEGALSAAKSASTCNRNLAKFALKHGLYRYVQHSTGLSDSIMTQLTVPVSVDELENAVSALSDSLIKILGDTVEALIGAVYVDSGSELGVLEGLAREVMEIGLKR